MYKRKITEEIKMKITKTASGKKTIKMSKKEWEAIGKKAGWTKKAQWAVPANKPGSSPMSGVRNGPAPAAAAPAASGQQYSISGAANWALGIGDPTVIEYVDKINAKAKSSGIQGIEADIKRIMKAMNGDQAALQEMKSAGYDVPNR